MFFHDFPWPCLTTAGFLSFFRYSWDDPCNQHVASLWCPSLQIVRKARVFVADWRPIQRCLQSERSDRCAEIPLPSWRLKASQLQRAQCHCEQYEYQWPLFSRAKVPGILARWSGARDAKRPASQQRALMGANHNLGHPMMSEPGRQPFHQGPKRINPPDHRHAKVSKWSHPWWTSPKHICMETWHVQWSQGSTNSLHRLVGHCTKLYNPDSRPLRALLGPWAKVVASPEQPVCRARCRSPICILKTCRSEKELPFHRVCIGSKRHRGKFVAGPTSGRGPETYWYLMIAASSRQSLLRWNL